MSEIASTGQLRAGFLRWALVLVPGIVLLGFLSGAAAGSSPHNRWFASLVKPAIYPPPLTFPIVWGLLYVLMGLALTFVVSSRGARWRGPAIAAFAVQLLLNLAWSPLFFGAHRILGGLILLLVLDAAVLATLVLFARVRRPAAALIAPYLAWIIFATVLNWQLLERNPDADGRFDSGVAVRVQI